MGKRSDADWGAIERHFRANRMSLNEIARQYGVSRPAITNRSNKEGWVRDLDEKIEQATKNKVAMGVAIREVAGNLPLESRLADRQVTELNAQAAAGVDLRQREDVQLAIDGQRAMLDELSELTKPEFRERLEWLGKVMDESGPTPSGGWKTDKLNELYQYVISLGGRIKMAKELAGAHGVYLPLQRKMFKLDEGKSAAPFEDLLARLGSAQQGGSV